MSLFQHIALKKTNAFLFRIKIYYHQKENGTDNFSDVVRNISRNFNNKAVMREKVINKMDCESLL